MCEYSLARSPGLRLRAVLVYTTWPSIVEAARLKTKSPGLAPGDAVFSVRERLDQ
jgi:hypothetical protein